MVHPNTARTFAVVAIVCICLILVVNQQLPGRREMVPRGRRPLSVQDTDGHIQDQMRAGVNKQHQAADIPQHPPDTQPQHNEPSKEGAQGQVGAPVILHEDVLDNLPADQPSRNVFPKPAPPLFLPLDNNELDPASQLREHLVRPIVYYVWCGKRWFEFKYYLAVVSIIRAMRPDKVLFYYEHYPPVDSNMYNIWIDDLKHDFQYFEMILMESKYAARICRGDRDLRLNELGYLVGYEGGVYISESTWMIDMPSDRRLTDVEMALDAEMEGYLIVRGRLITKETSLVDILYGNKSHVEVTKNSCSGAHHMVYKDVNAECIVVKGEGFNTLYPMDLVYKDNDPFAALVRKLFHGSDQIRKPTPSYDTLVPNIGHMIWIGGGNMDFVFYLSLLSMLYVVKVDVVYIHGDAPPKGPYWAKICTEQRIRDRVKLINRAQPSKVYQGKIEYYYRALMSDIIRVDLMIKYGGVYTDTDAIWVKPLSHEDRGYDAVATYDWVDWSYPFPDTVNFGVSYGKRNAPFYRLFRDSMRILHNDLHGYTGVSMPYKILEKHPDLLRIDRRLGVICYYSRCHPLWDKNYHNMTHDHVVGKTIPNWREDVHAFHWTHPNPTELHNETMLMHSTGMFAEIGKYVLESAGLL